ncbi:MAG: T9SS type A sorting domain-containing protein [Bacteroidota bacterium]
MKKLFLLLLIEFIAFSLFSQSWHETQKLLAPNRQAASFFGRSVATDKEYAIVGAEGAKSVVIFHRDITGVWSVDQTLTSQDISDNDNLGESVDINGNFAILGVPWGNVDLPPPDDVISGAGAAYIFERQSDGTWVEQIRMETMDTRSYSFYGEAVAISEKYAVMGGPYASYTVQSATSIGGAVLLYERDSTGQWTQKKKLEPAIRVWQGLFGSSVAIDGEVVVVGSPGELEHPSDSISLGGAAYVFERESDSSWKESRLVPDFDWDLFGSDFGNSVDIEGEYVVVGAPKLKTISSSEPSNLGGVLIFRKDSAGNWQEFQQIPAPLNQLNDMFGVSVAIEDGYIVVGANQEDEDKNNGNTYIDPGAAYVYKQDSAGYWTLASKIVTSDRSEYDEFGFSVDISNSTVIGGAFSEDWDLNEQNFTSNAGAVYIFDLCEETTENTIFPVACNEFVSPSGTHIWRQSGTYTDIIPNVAGCDSTITIKLAVDTVNTELVKTGLTFTAVDTTASTYQWLDCRNGFAPIVGETSYRYTAPQHGGWYAVEMMGDCIDTSFCYSTYSVGVEEPAEPLSNKIYPNPTQGEFRLELSALFGKKVELIIWNMKGQRIASWSHVTEESFPLFIPGPAGIYTLEIKTADNPPLFSKIIKQ